MLSRLWSGVLQQQLVRRASLVFAPGLQFARAKKEVKSPAFRAHAPDSRAKAEPLNSQSLTAADIETPGNARGGSAAAKGGMSAKAFFSRNKHLYEHQEFERTPEQVKEKVRSERRRAQFQGKYADEVIHEQQKDGDEDPEAERELERQIERKMAEGKSDFQIMQEVLAQKERRTEREMPNAEEQQAELLAKYPVLGLLDVRRNPIA